jgi:hypothetical protein
MAISSYFENAFTIALLSILIVIYLYLLFSPNQPHKSIKPRNFVIKEDLQSTFDLFLKEFRDSNSWGSSNYGGNKNFGNAWEDFENKGNKQDDFFESRYGISEENNKLDLGPNVPSDKFRCEKGWMSIRSEMNYKYLWMHSGDNAWMGATATIDTPLHRKVFEILPVNIDCSNGGWVLMREGDSKGFLMMVKPSGDFAIDEWVVKVGTEDVDIARSDERYYFLFEEDGYLLNNGSMAFVNVMPEAEYSIRGHTGGWDRSKAAGREFGAMMNFQFINATIVESSINKEEKEIKEAYEEDQEYIKQIALLPQSTEKRVISYGLYGGKPKYTTGAIRNVEMAKIYFPGWICRFYVTSDVPEDILSSLKALGAEIESIPSGMGYTSGMFWRFMVAEDETVDRYIIRDADSRPNARDRFAVESWIESKYAIHILRDHVNHCIVMNGGMWGK